MENHNEHIIRDNVNNANANSNETALTETRETRRETQEERAARMARAAEIEAHRQSILRASDENAARLRPYRVVNRPVKRTEPEETPEETPEEKAEREALKAFENEQRLERGRLTGLATSFTKLLDEAKRKQEHEVAKDYSLSGFMKEVHYSELIPTKILLLAHKWKQEHKIPNDWHVIDGMFQPPGGFPDGIIPIGPKRAPIVFTGGAVPAEKKGRTLQDMRAASESGSNA